jgi:hypothetical protein
MGTIWLNGSDPAYPALDVVVRSAGLSVQTWEGWQHRSRSSGGITKLQTIVCHHTASPPSTSFQSDWSYCAVGHPDAPVANMLLGRQGQVGIHSAGASNHAGSGGPWPPAGITSSRGTIGQDNCNANSIGIEAANSGVGEVWSAQMVDAYERLVAALCSAYGLLATDCVAHYEWGGPNPPTAGRKIDPWGPAEGVSYGGSRPWDMRSGSGFLAAVARRMTGEPEPDDDDVEPHLASMYHGGSH